MKKGTKRAQKRASKRAGVNIDNPVVFIELKLAHTLSLLSTVGATNSK
jgi:hypothetical protein